MVTYKQLSSSILGKGARLIQNIYGKSGKLFAKIPKKARLAVAGVVVVASIIGIFAIGNWSKSSQPVVRSEDGKIVLEGAVPQMTITDGFPIKGTLTPQTDASMYYIVSSEDKRALGAGNIAFSDGSFSRNLTFNSNDYTGKKGELQVYMQDKDGKVIDRVATEVTFK